jgi:hypothetical protein
MLTAILLVVGLLGIGLIVFGESRRYRASAPRSTEVAILPSQFDLVPSTTEPKGLPKDKVEPTKDKGKPGPTEKERPPIEGIPSEAMRDVGQYVVLEGMPPSVVLQRQRETDPWGRLRNGSKILTTYYLVSLPGYRSKIELDSGVHLVLWGNVPAFSAFPPVLESMVMLHAPQPGIDLDLTLDHGRIHLMNRKKPPGPVKARIRFHREIWDVILPDTSSEAVVELWGCDLPVDLFAATPKEEPPVTGVTLYVKGQALLTVRQQEHKLANLTAVGWTLGGGLSGPNTLDRLPDWWTSKLSPQGNPAVADAMLALRDYDQVLHKKPDVLDALLTVMRESPDLETRAMAPLHLGAIDALGHLLDALEDRQCGQVRVTACYVLRRWMSRGIDQRQEILRTLQQRKGYPRDKAGLIVRLLYACSSEAAARPQTYSSLINLLDHENLAVRELAWQQLALLVPPAARARITYDPAGDAEKRKADIAQWRQLIPEGKLPPR